MLIIGVLIAVAMVVVSRIVYNSEPFIMGLATLNLLNIFGLFAIRSKNKNKDNDKDKK